MLTKSAHRGPILLREGAAERSESFNIMIAGGNHTSAIVTLPYGGAVQLTDKSEFTVYS